MSDGEPEGKRATDKSPRICRGNGARRFPFRGLDQRKRVCSRIVLRGSPGVCQSEPWSTPRMVTSGAGRECGGRINFVSSRALHAPRKDKKRGWELAASRDYPELYLRHFSDCRLGVGNCSQKHLAG